MVHLNKFTSYFVFWIDNIVAIVVFTFFEIALIPLVYLKNIITITWASMGLFTTIANVAIWVFSGLFFSLFIAFRDVYYFTKILTMHDGCKAHFGIKDELAVEDIDDNKEIEAYNGARNTAIRMYFEIRK